MTDLSRERWRQQRLRSLNREVEVLRAERKRLEVLLGEACVYAGHHSGCDPWTLLGVFADTHGFDLARPAWVEERERAETARRAA